RRRDPGIGGVRVGGGGHTARKGTAASGRGGGSGTVSTEVRERGGQPPSAPERDSPAYRAELARWAAAARTVPGRLRSVGALLALLVLVFGALTAWQVSGRATASADVVNHSAPLSDGAAQLYRSLADADTAAATGFLQAGQETAAVRTRYND